MDNDDNYYGENQWTGGCPYCDNPDGGHLEFYPCSPPTDTQSE
jgi:hypothetical protein